MGIWRKKSIEELQIEPEFSGLKLNRSLHASDLVLFGIGAIIGAGLFSITGIAAAENAGPAIVLSFVIAAFGCLFAGLCYSELATMIPVSGSAYTYAYATMGELIAWIIGWDLILEYAIGAATVSISWSAYLVSFLHDVGIDLPTDIIASAWQPVKMPDGSMVYGVINLPALVVITLCSFVLIVGIRESAWLNKMLVFIKVAVVISFILLGIFYIRPENYFPFIPENTGEFGEFGWSGVLRAAGIVFFAYIGFDAVSTTAQEVNHPQKNIPIGLLGSLLFCTFLYILFAIVMTGLVHYTDLNVAAPVAEAIARTPFWWMHGLIKVAIIAGLTSVILVLLLGQSRIFYVMAGDGLLPRLFADIHPRFHTPWRSNLMLMVFVGLFASFAPISAVSHMTSIGTLFAFVIVCAGVMILRVTQPERPRPFKTPLYPLVPLLGIGVCTLMMASLGLENWLRLFVWLSAGLLIYAIYGRKHAKHGRKHAKR